MSFNSFLKNLSVIVYWGCLLHETGQAAAFTGFTSISNFDEYLVWRTCVSQNEYLFSDSIAFPYRRVCNTGSVSNDNKHTGVCSLSASVDHVQSTENAQFKLGKAGNQTLTHDDVTWYLGLPEKSPLLNRWKQRIAARILRLSFIISNKKPPRLLCPKAGQAFLEARVDGKQVGRFGITTTRGPPCCEMDESVTDLFGVNMPGAGAAAIIYMFVEPDFRGRGIGSLALELIAAIHAARGISFTVLVADDNGSNSLVNWYENQPLERKFKKAPKLQSLLGSPNGKYGVTMLAPTSSCTFNGQELLDRVQVNWW